MRVGGFMDFKEILTQGLKDGVGGFFNSVVDQINEQAEQSKEEIFEILDMCTDCLAEIQQLLKTIGADGKFDKDMKGVNEIYSWALLIAAVVDGQEMKNQLWANIKDENFQNLCERWELTKTFFESVLWKKLEIMTPSTSIFSFEGKLSEECTAFYNNISNLSYVERGLFAVRKIKKKIEPFSKRLSGVCAYYTVEIVLIHELF